MPDIMRTVLLLSLCGTALAVLLAVLRRLLKNRLPKALFYYLWLLVLLRLALPVALPVPGLELSLPEPAPAERAAQIPVGQSAPAEGEPGPFDPEGVFTLQEGAVVTGSGLPFQDETAGTAWYRQAWDWLCRHFTVLWLTGAALHFLWFALSYLRFCRTLREDCAPLLEHEQALLDHLRGKRRVSAFRSPLAATPMLVGLLRPRILLPETAVSTRELECILRHELTHLRRRDLLFKWAAVAVTSFHWFNPFMPWLRREIDRCCELSCDEAVIGSMNEDWKRTYGETLLALAAVSALPRAVPATTLCEEKAQLKERLVGIMKHKKVTAAILLLSCLLALLVAGCAAVLGPNAARRELPQAADYDLWIQADQKETFVRNWKAEYHDGTEVASVHFAPKDHSGDDYVFRGRDLPALRARVEAWAFAELPLDRDNCILYYQMEPELLLAASSQITVFPLDGGEPARMELSQLDMSTYCGHVTVTDLGDNGVWLVVLTDGDRAAQAQPTEPADPNQIAVLDLTGRVAVLIENAPLDNAFAETVDAEGRTVVMDMALTLRKGDLVWVESQEGGACAVTVLAGEPPRARGTLDVRLLSVEQTELEKANQVILKNAPQWAGPNEGLFAGAAVSGVAHVEARKDNWYCVTLPGGDNAFWVRREDIVFDAYILPWNDPEDSRKSFGEILWNAYLKGELPDGSKLDWTSSKGAAENHFAVTDIDGDGKEELLLSWTNASMAGHSFVIYGCWQGAVYTQFSGFPSLRFYDNAAIEEDWSHNQGWSGRFWPHYAYRYNPQSDLYEQVGFVEGWDKQVVSEGFPDDIDADGDGLVYDVRPADADWTIGSRYEPERMMDGPAYEEWRQSYLNGSQEVEIGLIPLTEENIAALGAPKPIAHEVKPVG